ncbi:MAG TPA: GIY-YIG nuclease family protein [Labilithrix sp.]|jgi:putative endonuclease
MSWYVYLARCTDGSLYCGVARDVAERFAQHDAGKGAKYTRGRGPLVPVAVRRCRTKGFALSLEHAVKQLPRDDKLALADTKRFASLARRIAARALSVAQRNGRKRP